MRQALFLPIFLILLATSAYASNTSVSVKTEGNSDISVNSTSQGSSTTCINGECTTTGGNSHTTACVDGECYESDGDLNIEKNNGDIKVNVDSNSNDDTSVNETKDTEMEENKTSESAKEKTEEKIEEIEKTFIEKIKEFFENIFSMFS